MRKELLAVFVSLALSAPAFAAKPKCDLPEWRELSHEASVLKSHAGVAQRDGNHLKITLENGKSIDLNDRVEGDEAGAASDIHRVVDAGPHGEWVTVFESGSDSFGYKVIHRKSGKVEELGGCPIWSPTHKKDGEYFVALHEDLESGKTSNEASLWFCEKPSESCQKIWCAPGSEGGRDAQWSGSKVRITLSKIDMDRAGQPEVIQTVNCSPKKANSGCIKPKAWKKAGK
ncbi:MAG: hypothetical protein ACJ763_00730 [Bdellovibrionia bacterium]